MRPSVPDVHITDPQDAELAAYRPFCGLAAVGLIFGFLSPFAVLDVLLTLLFPVPGVIINWLALRRIGSTKPPMSGRSLALCGAALSLVFLAAAPTEWLVYRKMVRDEALQFAPLWFDYLRHDEPQKAHQLTIPPLARLPLNDDVSSYYEDQKSHDQLGFFANSSPARTLLALGPRAQVRFYQTIDQKRDGERDWIDLCYAVTYDDQGEKKSFFVLLQLVRQKLRSDRAGWHVFAARGEYRPPGW